MANKSGRNNAEVLYAISASITDIPYHPDSILDTWCYKFDIAAKTWRDYIVRPAHASYIYNISQYMGLYCKTSSYFI